MIGPSGNKIMIRSLVGDQLILNLMAERSIEHIPWRSKKDGREAVGWKPSRTSLHFNDSIVSSNHAWNSKASTPDPINILPVSTLEAPQRV
jgi:hypothetical protein